VQSLKKHAWDNFVEHIHGIQNHIWSGGIGAELQLRMRSWSAAHMLVPEADYVWSLIALFFKAKYRLNRAELEEACVRQFRRAHSWHSESYMVWGYWSWTSTFRNAKLKCGPMPIPKADYVLRGLIALFFKAEYRLNHAELEEACLRQFCRSTFMAFRIIYGLGVLELNFNFECEVEVRPNAQYQKRTMSGAWLHYFLKPNTD
jgi:hypothetical protein